MAVPLAAFPAAASPDTRVYAFGDGIPHSPEEYANLLSRLAEGGKIPADEYSRGGIVAQLEARVAAALGKETAVWLPTGTLANHLALRILSGNKRRALVQAESHLYNDCGDCAQTLSGLTLIPLARGSATFRLEDVELAAKDAEGGRVRTSIGAIQIETPVRRRAGERFDFSEMKKISAWAREHKVGMHLDGARLFIESAYTGRPVREYAALFDTVYVSMYKYFNAASGAVLAGPKSLLGDLFDTRRMFGGGLYHSWPFAAVAQHYMNGFEERLGPAVAASQKVLEALDKDGNYGLERVSNGTNVFRFRVFGVNSPVYGTRLEEAGISVRPPSGEWFTMQVNETWARCSPEEIIRRFRTAMG